MKNNTIKNAVLLTITSISTLLMLMFIASVNSENILRCTIGLAVTGTWDFLFLYANGWVSAKGGLENEFD